jgi:hypothetical protein
MGRYATREDEIDRMLRSRLFVDLYGVVIMRHGLRASVESYSIKKLEPLYEYKREVVLSDANSALSKNQAHLELGDHTGVEEQDRQVVQGYNRDDCLSTWRLRDWLEGLRSDLIAKGNVIDRPVPEDGGPGEDPNEWQEKIDTLMRRLTADVPNEVAERNSITLGHDNPHAVLPPTNHQLDPRGTVVPSVTRSALVGAGLAISAGTSVAGGRSAIIKVRNKGPLLLCGPEALFGPEFQLLASR